MQQKSYLCLGLEVGECDSGQFRFRFYFDASSILKGKLGPNPELFHSFKLWVIQADLDSNFTFKKNNFFLLNHWFLFWFEQERLESKLYKDSLRIDLKSKLNKLIPLEFNSHCPDRDQAYLKVRNWHKKGAAIIN